MNLKHTVQFTGLRKLAILLHILAAVAFVCCTDDSVSPLQNNDPKGKESKSLYGQAFEYRLAADSWQDVRVVFENLPEPYTPKSPLESRAFVREQTYGEMVLVFKNRDGSRVISKSCG